MKAQERREAMLEQLCGSARPLSGGSLAKALGVSRQVVVQDVALLRAEGHDIMATARGYVLMGAAKAPAVAQPSLISNKPQADYAATSSQATRHTRVIKVCHTVAQTADELFTILESDGQVLDVSVSHRVYGRLSAKLDILTLGDALRFLDDIESGKSSPLLTVTSGYHYHTIAADSEATLDRIERALAAKGYLAPFLPHEHEDMSAASVGSPHSATASRRTVSLNSPGPSSESSYTSTSLPELARRSSESA